MTTTDVTSTGIAKNYYLMNNIGKSKYTVNFYDGEKTHRDGSAFYDIAIFSNKRRRDAFVRNLIKQGYVYR